MRKIFLIIVVFFVATVFTNIKSNAQEAERRPKKRKTFEAVEKENLEKIRQLEETLLREREMRQRDFQQQEQLLHMMYEKDISPEQEKELLETIKKENPEEVKELMLLKKENPIEFRKILIQRQYEIQRLSELKERDPERYEYKKKQQALERQSRQLVKKYRIGKDEKAKAKIKKELSSVLSQLFDLREKDREEEIKHLTEKLDHLKSVLAERKKKKQEIVERRVQEMLGEIDVLLW